MSFNSARVLLCVCADVIDPVVELYESDVIQSLADRAKASSS